MAQGLAAERLLVLVFPTRPDLAGFVASGRCYWSTLLDALAQRGIAALDLAQPLAAAAGEAGGIDALYLQSHLSPLGNEIVARELARWLGED